MKKTEKNISIIPKKLIFGKTFMKFTIAVATPKIMDTIDMSKFLQRINEQLLKVSDFKSKSSKRSLKIRSWVTPRFNNKTVHSPFLFNSIWLRFMGI